MRFRVVILKENENQTARRQASYTRPLPQGAGDPRLNIVGQLHIRFIAQRRITRGAPVWRSDPPPRGPPLHHLMAREPCILSLVGRGFSVILLTHICENCDGWPTFAGFLAKVGTYGAGGVILILALTTD